MPCLVGLLALIAPRVVAVVLWLFTRFFEAAFAGRLLWLVLGIVIAPFTTLAYAWTINAHGRVEGIWLAIVIVAAIADLSALAGGGRRYRSGA
jgi:hypothetical protein